MNGRSEQVAELFGALAKAQAIMAGAKKDATNPHFKSKYADLASVWDACREALTANGLAVIQTTEPSEGAEVRVHTTLAHSSGQHISGVIAIPVNKNDAQGYGSALTYARRYALAAMVGIAPADDDGNAASDARPIQLTNEQISAFKDAIKTGDRAEEWKKAAQACKAAGDTAAYATLKAFAVELSTKQGQKEAGGSNADN
jgi:hypothetical protein